MTTISTVSATALGVIRSGVLRNGPYRSQLGFVTCLAMLLAWPLLLPDQATALDIFRIRISSPPCGDTIFFPPCDTVSGAGGTSLPVRPRTGVSAGQSGQGAHTQGAVTTVGHGIWSGAQLELVTTDPYWVNQPDAPGRAIAVDTRGRIYLLYRRVLSTRVKATLQFTYKVPGATWSAEIPLPVSPQRFVHAGVAVSPKDDVPHFFYLDGGYFEPSYIVHGAYDFVGQVWSVDTVALSTEEYWHEGQTFSFDVDSIGGLHVAWSDPGWNTELQRSIDQIWYANNTSGTWRKQRITDLGAGGYVRVDPSGRAYVNYLVRRDNHNFSIVASNRFRGDTVWTADSTDTSPTTYTMTGFITARDGTQHTLFYGRSCYYCSGDYRLFYTQRASGGVPWKPLEQIADSSYGGYLQVDCSGNAHVLHGRLLYGGPWITSNYATNAMGLWSSRELDFGPIPSWLTDSHDYMLDWYDRGHVIMTADTNGDFEMEFYHYAAPSVPLDVFDVIEVLHVVYLGREGKCDPLRYDLDCDQFVDVADVWRVINYVFNNGPRGCRF